MNSSRALKASASLQGGVDLGLGELAPGFHLGGDESRERLSGAELIAFLRKKFHDPPAGARRDVHLVHLDRARNRLGARPAGGERKREGGRGRRRERRTFSIARRGKITNFLLKRKAAEKPHDEKRRFDHIDLRVSDLADAQALLFALVAGARFHDRLGWWRVVHLAGGGEGTGRVFRLHGGTESSA